MDTYCLLLANILRSGEESGRSIKGYIAISTYARVCLKFWTGALCRWKILSFSLFLKQKKCLRLGWRIDVRFFEFIIWKSQLKHSLNSEWFPNYSKNFFFKSLQKVNISVWIIKDQFYSSNTLCRNLVA